MLRDRLDIKSGCEKCAMQRKKTILEHGSSVVKGAGIGVVFEPSVGSPRLGSFWKLLEEPAKDIPSQLALVELDCQECQAQSKGLRHEDTTKKENNNNIIIINNNSVPGAPVRVVQRSSLLTPTSRH